MPTPHADGPDLSHYQTLTGQPVDPTWRLFAHKCSEGRTSGDAMFPARWQWARKQGFKYRGAYHWLRSDSTMALQAVNLTQRLDALGGLQRGEFVQCDWERTSNVADPTAAQTAEWCDRVEQHYGRACVIVYSSDWLSGFTTWRNLRPDFPLWYANYVTVPNFKHTDGWAECAKHGADVWQWTNSFAHASITPQFDMNHIFNAATLDRITDQQQAPVPAPNPPEAKPVVYFYRHSAYKNVWLCGPGGALAVGQEVVDAGAVQGIPTIVNAHQQSLVSVLATSGLGYFDLVPA